ncbi:hypothetical protein BSKO_12390 [Bryopsis sp. KO-2023]|nr:hypothetical protein BSKO_12390 [Bryopsis sp. KO-2023]
MASVFLRTTRESAFLSLQLLCRTHGGYGNCGSPSSQFATVVWFLSPCEPRPAAESNVAKSKLFSIEERDLWNRSREGLSGVGGPGWRSRGGNWDAAENRKAGLIARGFSSKAGRSAPKKTRESVSGKAAEGMKPPTGDDSGVRESGEKKSSAKSRQRSSAVTRTSVSFDALEVLGSSDDQKGSGRIGALDVRVGWLTEKLGLKREQVLTLAKQFPSILDPSVSLDTAFLDAFSKKAFSGDFLEKNDFGSKEIFDRFRDLEGLSRFLEENLSITRSALAKFVSHSPKTKRSLPLLKKEDLERVVVFFKELELTRDQIGRILFSQYHVIGLSFEKRLKPVVNYLLRAGISKEGVGSMVRRHPQMLMLKVKDSIEPRFEWFRKLGLSDVDVLRVVRAAPELLGCNLEKMITTKFEWLASDIGISHDAALGCLVRDPKMFECNLATLQNTVEMFRSWGVDDAGMRVLITKMPSVASRNREVLLEKFVFARDVLKKEPETIMESPRYFSSSFEGLILMRVAFLQRLGWDPVKYSLNYLVRSKHVFNKQFSEKVVEEFETEWCDLSKKEMLKSITRHQQSGKQRLDVSKTDKKPPPQRKVRVPEASSSL